MHGAMEALTKDELRQQAESLLSTLDPWSEFSRTKHQAKKE